MIERLAEDHANARRLAEGWRDLPGILSAGGIAQPGAGPSRSGSRSGRTSSCSVSTRDRRAFLDGAPCARNVLMVEYPHGQVRAVTHPGVAAADIDATILRRSARRSRRRPGRRATDRRRAPEQLQGV